MQNIVLTGLRWLDQNVEKVIMVIAYSACAGIVAVEVFRRYVFQVQAPWSTFVPSYMFLWITWLGCAYCVRARLHLSFNEIRDRLARHWQFALMQFDYVLYLVFGSIVIYYSYDLVALQYRVESIVPGTDDVLSWWFYSATPVGWSLLIFRVAQNVIEDVRTYLNGAPMVTRGSLMSID